MIIKLQDLDAQTRSLIAQGFFKLGGEALFLMHPFFRGATVTDREAGVHLAMDKGPVIGAGGASREDILAAELSHYARYLSAIQGLLDGPLFPVAFLFEVYGNQEHIRLLQSLDRTTRVWILVETREAGADPREGTLEVVIRQIADMQVKYPRLAGCYSAVDETGWPVRTDIHYSCLNDLLYRSIDSKRFVNVGLVPEAVYAEPLPPPEYRNPSKSKKT